jgi:hypothetical protein
MSRLTEFYRGAGCDSEGRTLEEILNWGDEDLEDVHDFIQWLFPLPEPSGFNPHAPLLSADDIRAFRGDALLQANLRRSFARILRFLGLIETLDGGIVDGDHFAGRAGEVWAHPNHNWLRVTRILRSLTLLGEGEKARSLYAWLEASYRAKRFPIPTDTFRYWTGAIQANPPAGG